MNTSISAMPERQRVRDAPIMNVFWRMNWAWCTGWVKYTSQMRGGVK